MNHEVNDNEHRAECRACRQAYRAPNSPGYVPPRGGSPMHPHGDDNSEPRLELCPNTLCANRRVPEGRMVEHFTRYPKCNPNPLQVGWTKNAYGEAGAYQLLHEFEQKIVDGRLERIPCRQTILAATETDIPLKIASHVMKRHKS